MCRRMFFIFKCNESINKLHEISKPSAPTQAWAVTPPPQTQHTNEPFSAQDKHAKKSQMRARALSSDRQRIFFARILIARALGPAKKYSGVVKEVFRSCQRSIQELSKKYSSCLGLANHDHHSSVWDEVGWGGVRISVMTRSPSGLTVAGHCSHLLTLNNCVV